MKKITSLIMAVLMLCTMLTVFALPAFAEEEATVINPSDGKIINIPTAGDYVIKAGEYSVDNFVIGLPINSGVVLTIPEGVTVTVNSNLNNFGTLYVHGTLIVKASNAINSGTIHVGCSGKLNGIINGIGTVTYEEHKFADGKCSVCGKFECEVTGEHAWDAATGKCSVCETACKHEWDAATGKCTVCQYECPHDGNTCVVCGAKINGGSLALGSALSEGNMIIIVGVACSVVFLAVGLFIGTKKKKKPALASGENKDEE